MHPERLTIAGFEVSPVGDWANATGFEGWAPQPATTSAARIMSRARLIPFFRQLDVVMLCLCVGDRRC